MDFPPKSASLVTEWLDHLAAVPPAPSLRRRRWPAADDLVPALALLAAEALARGRTLQIVTPEDGLLPEISAAIDFRLRPLCLVMPAQEPAARITLRATLALAESRLARGGEDAQGPAWDAFRRHLEDCRATWVTALSWKSRGSLIEPPPPGVRDLFPVQIGPAPAGQERLADWYVFLDEPQTLPEGARRTLILLPPLIRRWLAPSDAGAREALEFEMLSHQLAEMELELATAENELAAFARRYQAVILPRQRELARLRGRVEPAGGIASASSSAEAETAEPFVSTPEDAPSVPRPATDLELKKRFRQIAQKIHPDRASSEAERLWRTALMKEANEAYRRRDALALEAVFSRFCGRETEPAPASAKARGRQLMALRRRLREIEKALDRLYGSRLYALMTAARQAAAEGRDLIAEIAARLDGEIQALRGMAAAS